MHEDDIPARTFTHLSTNRAGRRVTYVELTKDVTTRPSTAVKNDTTKLLFAYHFWNEIPLKIRSSSSLVSFKKHLRTYYFCCRMVCGDMAFTVFVGHAVKRIDEIWQIDRGGLAIHQGQDW